MIESQKQLGTIAKALSEYGVLQWHSDHIPTEKRNDIATFVAPARVAFDHRPADADADQVLGEPRYKSSHGMHPDSPDDDRLCVIHGAGIKPKRLFTARTGQLAPTFAGILGLDTDCYPKSAMQL